MLIRAFKRPVRHKKRIPGSCSNNSDYAIRFSNRSDLSSVAMRAVSADLCIDSVRTDFKCALFGFEHHLRKDREEGP